MWKVFWPQCHTERAFHEAQRLWPLRLPLHLQGIHRRRASADYSDVEVPNALWHQTHTFTCFAFPTFSEDCEQVGAALRKVILAYTR